MPRKRKRSTLQWKPSLIFTESPVHVQNNVPSPVLCARHPPTAVSVPIDNLEELPWVSPQFRRIPSSVGPNGRKRINRQRRKSTGATLGSLSTDLTTNRHNPHIDPQVRNKFRSLKFVGDPSALLSLNEDVHISFDTDTATDDESERKNNRRISEHQDTPCDIGDPEKNKIKRRGNLRKKFGRSLENIHFDPDSSYDENTVKVTSAKFTNDENSDSASDKNSKHTKSAIKTNPHNTDTSSLLLNESSEIDFTHFRAKPLHGNAPIKRLFSSQLNLLNPETSDKDKCSESEVDTVSNTESEGEAGPTVSVRRSAKIKMLHKLFRQTDSPICNRKSAEILVADTPEAEYGWPLKKYQLRAYLQNR